MKNGFIGLIIISAGLFLHTLDTTAKTTSEGVSPGESSVQVTDSSVLSPHRSSPNWKPYDGYEASSVSGYMDIPFMEVSDKSSNDAFRIAGNGRAATIYYSEDDAAVAGIAANALRDDVERVTGLVPEVSTKTPSATEAILIGTIGSSPLIDQLIAAGKINVSAIEGKWEAYTAAVVNKPMKGVGKALIIAGSDRRGTAFGVFALSESMGVSPWHFWGDVSVPQQTALFIEGSHTQSSPGVKYRGIFLNDEDWGLQPWAANTFEPEVGNIGPKTYATIYELLLRLHANCIWPAMHEFPVETTPFYLVPGNKEMADKYAIVISTSHHEPMMRNSHEYNEKTLGPYDYWNNRESIYNFWEKRVEETANYENIYTMGMRGRSDAGMLAPEGTTNEQKAKKIQNEIIPDQRKMISDHVNTDPSEIPQIFIPYKETLVQYQAGLQLPDDVTIVWPDDNHGYIRQLSTSTERARSGSSGVYYHLSYWGVPSSYLWFCTTPPGMTCFEMLKAWDFEANKIWLVNVGDLKPMEIGTDFFLRMARDPEAFRDFDQHAYLTQWASRTFGKKHAEAIAEILDNYYRLNIVKRPEHLNRESSGFSFTENGDEAQKRLDDFAALTATADSIYNMLPAGHKPSFYEMVLYQIRASYHVNRRTLSAERSRLWAEQKRAATPILAAEAKAAHEALIAEVAYYNTVNANGKWNYMMNPMDISKLPRWARDTQNPFIEPAYGIYDAPLSAGLGVATEGSATPLTQGIPGTLPPFSRPANPKYFIDIFNTGSTATPWTLECNEAWVVLSEQSGQEDSRIIVSIDWEKAPFGNAVPATIKIADAGSIYTVNLNVFNPDDLDIASLPGIVEDNGLVVIEAENYSTRVDANDGTGWRKVNRAAASKDGMAIYPVTTPSLDPLNIPLDAPSLTYRFYAFSTGMVKVMAQCLPTHRITSDHQGLRYAISINDDKPQVIDVNATEYSPAWRANTLRAASVGSSNHVVMEPGIQTIRIWMIDAGVVLDKITLMFANGTFEAEDFKLLDSETPVEIFSDTPASGGKGLHIKAGSEGDLATVVIPNIMAGNYMFYARVKKWNSRGIVQMAVAEKPDGPYKDIGKPYDLYDDRDIYTDLEPIPVIFSSDGSKYLRFKITGKNTLSNNYWVLLDYISFKPDYTQ